MTDSMTHAEFGNPDPIKCDKRVFFEHMRHPGAANCACPKFADGSCVPYNDWERWFDAIGLYRKSAVEERDT